LRATCRLELPPRHETTATLLLTAPAPHTLNQSLLAASLTSSLAASLAASLSSSLASPPPSPPPSPPRLGVALLDDLPAGRYMRTARRHHTGMLRRGG